MASARNALETPPLRVSRPVSACARCRSAKVRCDGKLPACTACEKVGRAKECSSSNDQFARGKERSFVSSLESQIERLEQKIAYREHRKESVVSIDFTNSNRAALTAPSIVHKGTGANDDVNELVSDFGHMSVNAVGSNAYDGYNKEMSLARLVRSIAVDDEVMSLPDIVLPPRHEATALIQTCMANILLFCPIQSSTAIFGALDRVYQSGGQLSSFYDVWNTRLLLAIAIMSRSRNKGDLEYQDASRHVAVAMRNLGEYMISPSSVDRLQSVLLLVLYSTLDPFHFNCWYLNGLACRMMSDMGLHAYVSDQPPTDAQPVDAHRRAFHCIYILDRTISMSRLRPFNFSDDSVDLSLPNSFEPPSIESSATGPGPSHTLGDLGTQSPVDYALLLLQITQRLSSSYQELFFSGREVATQAWTTRIDSIRNIQASLQKIPPSTSPPIKSFIIARILYNSILLVLPQADSIQITSSYGQALVFEYMCDYAANFSLMPLTGQGLAYTQYDDFLRTLLVARRLLRLCCDSQSPLHMPVEPYPTGLISDAAVPRLQWLSFRTDALGKAIDAALLLDQVLDRMSFKYGQRPTYDTWKTELTPALNSLYTKHQQRIQYQQQLPYTDMTIPSQTGPRSNSFTSQMSAREVMQQLGQTPRSLSHNSQLSTQHAWQRSGIHPPAPDVT